MSNPNPSGPPITAPRWLVWLLVLAFAAYAVFLHSHTTAVAAGSDSSGYLNSAQLFAQGRLVAEQRLVPELSAGNSVFHFMPLGFWPSQPPGKFVPTYPPGLPLHFALAGLLTGWNAGPLLVILSSALAAVWFCYLAARELGLAPTLAAAGAATLACSPLFLFSSLQPLSDTLAATWCLIAVWAALRARRGELGWAAACGAAFAVAVLVRPSNALLLPCLLMLLGDWRRLAAAALGGLPGALWLGYLNHALYGGALRSGYGDITPLLETQWFWPTLAHFGHWLVRLLPAGVVILPLAALLRWRGQTRTLLALALWAAAFLLFYAFYSVSHETWWCLRFILPAVPALILSALLGLDAICARASSAALTARWRHAAAAGWLLWALGTALYWNPRLDVLHLGRYETVYLDATRWANAHLPKNALVACMFASGSVYYYTDFPILRWDLIPPEDFRLYAGKLRHSGRPLYALLFPGEQDSALQEHMPDKWEKVGEVSGIGFWKLSAAP